MPFDLPPEDKEYLDANQQNWKKCSEGQGKYGLIVEDFRIPKGFDITTSTLMLLIPAGYPAAPLDMFYFNPPLGKKNGQIPDRLTSEIHFGTSWQRWSRHYDWHVGVHSLVSHIEYIYSELREEGLR